MGEVRKSAVLISLTLDGLKNMLSNLDYTKIQLMAVVSDSTENIDVRINEQQIPFYDFSKMDEVINYTKGDDVYYLVCGYRNHLREFGMVARMIRLIGNISKERIINISLIFEQNWLLNYKLAMQGDLDFFATGISYMMAGLSLNDLPLGCGVNLATSSQDIFYGLETAKRVFLQNHKVRYTFIGLSPYAFSYCMDETFSTSGMTTVYELAWNAGGSSLVNSFIKASLFQSQITISGEYDAEANLKNEVLRLKHMLDLDRELHDILPNGDLVRITKNKKWLKEYIDLCRQNECIPVGVVFPMASLLRKKYPQNALREYRNILHDFEMLYDFVTIDLWDMELPLTCFYDLPHLNRQGAKVVTRRLYEEMKRRNLVMYD